MKLNEVIRTRRQTLGLTQEQLAQALGVSAPAVNKWERNLNYPDITLLPALARTLGVDMNTLLSFQEDLTDQEIGEFLNWLYEVSQTGGCETAFALAEDKLREYPNSDKLAYSVAGILGGILALRPEEAGPERETREAEVTALYERCVRSADSQIREWAAYTLASRCVGAGELERAETLLGQLSDTHRDKQGLTARLRWAQGQREDAWVLAEQELFNQAHTIQSTLLSMLDWALKEGDRERARVFSDTAVRSGEVFDLSDYAVLSTPFQLAAAEEDGPRALALLDRLLESLTVPWDLSASPLYSHLSTKDATEESQRGLIPLLLDSMERDPECAFLRTEPGYQELLQKYRENT